MMSKLGGHQDRDDDDDASDNNHDDDGDDIGAGQGVPVVITVNARQGRALESQVRVHRETRAITNKTNLNRRARTTNRNNIIACCDETGVE